MGKRVDIIGKKFHRLTAISRVDAARHVFLCSCGTEKEIFTAAVKAERTKSCGCLSAEWQAAMLRFHENPMNVGKHYTNKNWKEEGNGV